MKNNNHVQHAEEGIELKRKSVQNLMGDIPNRLLLSSLIIYALTILLIYFILNIIFF